MKVDFITVHLDNTVSIKRCPVIADEVVVRKGKGANGWRPKLKSGRSVFPERKQKGLSNIFRRSHRYVWGVEGNPECFALNEDAGKLDDYWNTDEGKKFVSKMIALSAAAQKPFSNLQVVLMLIGFIVLATPIFYMIWKLGI